MSQVYIASMSRGLQSSSPFRHASCTAVINEPMTCALRPEANHIRINLAVTMLNARRTIVSLHERLHVNA